MAVRYRTNLTMCRIAPRFAISAASVCRVIPAACPAACSGVGATAVGGHRTLADRGRRPDPGP
ncbi:hypothetical protein ACFVU0_16215 [Streptomyces sp. NPDC058122]|uniref:hypothetical protein n=1 Tax=Streptomyces sp. NPDC058122 TaxID=3346349 RepID=UPI0036F12746